MNRQSITSLQGARIPLNKILSGRLFPVLFLMLLLMQSVLLYAQERQSISLSPARMHLPSRSFNIQEVLDQRSEKASIGIVHIGSAQFETPLFFEKELSAEVLDFFQGSMTYVDSAQNLSMGIKTLFVSESLNDTLSSAQVDLVVDFYFNGALLFHTAQKVVSKALDVSKHHTENVEQALTQAVEELNAFLNRSFPENNTEVNEVNDESVEFSQNIQTDDYYVKAFNETKESLPDISTQEKREKLQEHFNRNVISVGYQIGGLTLIGADYEVRINDLFGVHAGAGLRGYNAGFRLHMRATKRSSFFDLSFKDGGFGLINMVSSEFGSRIYLMPKRNDFAFHTQVGLGVLTHIDSEFARFLFGTDPVPPLWLSVGVGFSW